MAVQQYENELHLHPINDNEYLASIYVNSSKMINNSSTTVILDRSGSMNEQTSRFVTVIIPMVMSILGYDHNYRVNLITFAAESKTYRKTCSQLKVATGIMSKGKTNFGPAIAALRELLELHERQSPSIPMRVLTISDGEINDPNDAIREMKKLVNFLATSDLTINSQAVRLFTSSSQPDTKALSYMLRLNNTVVTRLYDARTNEADRNIADNIARLFLMDCFHNHQFLNFQRSIVLKFPWNTHACMRVILSPGWNIFWFKHVPSGVRLGNDTVNVVVRRELSLGTFHELMEWKLEYITDHMIILKIVDTKEAITNVNEILECLKRHERTVAYNSSTPNTDIISNLLKGIANSRTNFHDSNQMATFLRETKAKMDIQREYDRKRREEENIAAEAARIKQQEEERRRREADAEAARIKQREDEERRRREADAEAARIKQQKEEEEKRRREAEAARIKQQQEEEEKRRREAEAEAARIKQQQEEEEKRRREAEAEAARIKQQQEEEEKRRREAETEAARIKQQQEEEEKRRREAEAEAARIKQQQEEEEKRRSEAEAEAARIKQQQEEEEKIRREAEAEAARIKQQQEEEEKKRIEAEAARIKLQEEKAAEAARIKLEEEKAAEAARIKLEEEKAAEAARIKLEEEKAAEAARIKLEEEKAAEAARIKLEEEEAAEAARIKLEEDKAAEAARIKLEEEKAAEAARIKLEEEKAAEEEEARIKLEEEKAAEEEEARIKLEEQKAAKEEEARIKKLEEEKAAEEEEVRIKKLEEEKAAEEEEARIKLEEEKAAEEEEARIKKLEEEKAAEEEEARIKLEEEKAAEEEEARIKLEEEKAAEEEEARINKLEEEKAAEEEEARIKKLEEEKTAEEQEGRIKLEEEKAAEEEETRIKLEVQKAAEEEEARIKKLAEEARMKKLEEETAAEEETERDKRAEEDRLDKELDITSLNDPDDELGSSQTVFILDEHLCGARGNRRLTKQIVPLMLSRLFYESSDLVQLVTFVRYKTTFEQLRQSLLQTLDAKRQIRIFVLTNERYQERKDINVFAEMLIRFLSVTNYSFELQVVRLTSTRSTTERYEVVDVSESNDFIAKQIAGYEDKQLNDLRMQDYVGRYCCFNYIFFVIIFIILILRYIYLFSTEDK
ncbi:trichohyalin-like isoform X5 [Bradysia coprophila]|uniref:trichohyalin-like isoform X5 n=1 Tax=Bradysia coprophila TaxID=38358 RepID=UPI00187DC7E2|nr:trichohyalin-like isoform X5 [Bradysia coprophila]